MTKIFQIRIPAVTELTGIDVITAQNDPLVRAFINLLKIEKEFDATQEISAKTKLKNAFDSFHDQFGNEAWSEKIAQKIAQLHIKLDLIAQDPSLNANGRELAENFGNKLATLIPLVVEYFESDNEEMYNNTVAQIDEISNQEIRAELESYPSPENNKIFAFCKSAFESHNFNHENMVNFMFVLKEIFEARDFAQYNDLLLEIAIPFTITLDNPRLKEVMREFFTDETLERKIAEYKTQPKNEDDYEIIRIAHILAFMANKEQDAAKKKLFLQDLSEILQKKRDLLPKPLSDYNPNFPFDFMIKNALFCEQNGIQEIPEILKTQIRSDFNQLKEFTKFTQAPLELFEFLIRNFSHEENAQIVSLVDEENIFTLFKFLAAPFFVPETTRDKKMNISPFAANIFSRLAQNFRENGYKKIEPLSLTYRIFENFLNLEESGNFEVSEKLIADFREIVFIGTANSRNHSVAQVCAKIIEQDNKKYQALKPMAHFVLFQYNMHIKTDEAVENAAKNFMQFYNAVPEDKELKERAEKNILLRILLPELSNNANAINIPSKFIQIVKENFSCKNLLSLAQKYSRAHEEQRPNQEIHATSRSAIIERSGRSGRSGSEVLA